jgi:hypothetical protein
MPSEKMFAALVCVVMLWKTRGGQTLAANLFKGQLGHQHELGCDAFWPQTFTYLTKMTTEMTCAG